jgi:hypothetical protein
MAVLNANSVYLGSLTTNARDALGGVSAGTIIWNSTTSTGQIYNGTTWVDFANSVYANGGIITTPGNGYTYHTFTSPGVFTISSPRTVDVLLVAGGGGGGSGFYGGGGGAGGLIYRPAFPIARGSYPVQIGAGGAGAEGSGESGLDGTPGWDSTFSTLLTAKGGGNGSGRNRPGPGGAGGSGGGMAYGPNNPGPGPATQPSQPGDSGTYGYGTPGGIFYGGGGGGAALAGNLNPTRPAPTTTPASYSGGLGKQYPNFTGPLIGVPGLNPHSGYFAGGGGGGGLSSGTSLGGLGGGGSGGTPSNLAQQDGFANTGGGGGGTWNTNKSGNGGSGICVIIY